MQSCCAILLLESKQSTQITRAMKETLIAKQGGNNNDNRRGNFSSAWRKKIYRLHGMQQFSFVRGSRFSGNEYSEKW